MINTLLLFFSINSMFVENHENNASSKNKQNINLNNNQNSAFLNITEINQNIIPYLTLYSTFVKFYINNNQYCIMKNDTALFLNNKHQVIKKLKLQTIEIFGNYRILQNIEKKEELFLAYNGFNLNMDMEFKMFVINKYETNSNFTKITFLNNNQEIEYTWNKRTNLLINHTIITFEGSKTIINNIYQDGTNLIIKQIVTTYLEGNLTFQSKIIIENIYNNINSYDFGCFDVYAQPITPKMKGINTNPLKQIIKVLENGEEEKFKSQTTVENNYNIQTIHRLEHINNQITESFILIENYIQNDYTQNVNRQVITQYSNKKREKIISRTLIRNTYNNNEYMMPIAGSIPNFNKNPCKQVITIFENGDMEKFTLKTISNFEFTNCFKVQKLKCDTYRNGDEKTCTTQSLEHEYDFFGAFYKKTKYLPL